ncbi:MAG TPA: GNAT family N-acetyltransferase [Tepidisphaeraceae bacterium]|nr:GNAT family N-acetyltransferase [Tepidisphaeraceae bacterium]
MTIDRLETPRLVIRRFVESDLDGIAKIQDACFGHAPRDGRKAWIEWTTRNYNALAQLHQPPYGDHAITKDDVVIGAVGLVQSFGPFAKLPVFSERLRIEPSDLFTPEMGLFWAIAPEQQGHGYATEAAGALVRFAFEQLNAERLVATTTHDNLASIEVMRKLGMSIEKNPEAEPPWFQTIGVLFNPRSKR